MAKSEKFTREPKEYTDEPSVDEVGDGMKRGGHARHKKHMAMGGGMGGAPMAMRPPMGAPAGGQPMPARRPMMQRPPANMRQAVAGQQPALLSKRGGKAHHAEGGKAEKAEMHEMHKLEKELKHHEGMKAGKAHHGLKKGGAAAMAKDNTPGGLLGGLEATRPNSKKDTGDIELSKYKHGGKTHRISGHEEGTKKHHLAMAKHHAAKHAEGGSAHHAKMHEHHKHMAKMCGGGYKDGGSIAAKGDAFQARSAAKPKINVQDTVVDGSKNKSAGSSTGRVVNTVAGEHDGGYKRGGHAHKKHHYAKGGTVSESVANRYLNDMQDGEKNKKAGHKTGDIELSKFKKGGHVHHGHAPHHTTHGHHDAGHMHMHKEGGKHAHGHHKVDGHPMKKGGSMHTSKISTCVQKKGGSCNY